MRRLPVRILASVDKLLARRLADVASGNENEDEDEDEDEDENENEDEDEDEDEDEWWVK